MEEYFECKVIKKGNNELHIFQPNIMYKLENEFGVEVCDIYKY